MGDAFDRDRLQGIVVDSRPDAVINQLTAIPRRLQPRRARRAMEATNRLRREGTEALIDAAKAAGARLVVSQSISFVYGPRGASLATEEDPLYDDAPASFRDMVEAVRACERATLDAVDMQGIVLRYGYFYGLGTIYARDGSFAEDVMRRRVPIPGDGGGTFSFIHVDDAARATAAALEAGEEGIYNIVDDEPSPWGEWLPDYARLLGAPRPLRVPGFLARIAGGQYGRYLLLQQRGASNQLAKRRLGWTPSYRSWREGFRAELAS